MLIERTDLRNIAIIARVDGLLRQSHTFRENQQVAERLMDSNNLELDQYAKRRCYNNLNNCLLYSDILDI